MYTLQIKTIELLIIDALHSNHIYSPSVNSAFEQTFQHFANEEYLYGVEHTKILTKIFLNGYYKFRTAKALSLDLHLDTKTLLSYRKSYLHLFAKFYLNLSVPTKTDLMLLYAELNKQKRTASSSRPAIDSVTL